MYERTLGTFVLSILVCVTAQAQVDLSGSWAQRVHVDQADRGGGPDYGDYTGLPISEAGVRRAESWSDQKWSVLEHQCEPHPADYAPNGPGDMRIWSEVDAETQKLTAIHMTLRWMLPHRTVWMDGRPHPNEYVPHTWQGFSTGQWQGDVLMVTTTHLKEGWIRRNGVSRSDAAKLTEFWTRHGNVLTIVSVVDDPQYLTEPMVRNWNWELNPGYLHEPYKCTPAVEVELARGFVAHWLPGQNPLLKDMRAKQGLPTEVARGGAEQIYPEYRVKLRELLEAPKSP